MLVPSLETEEFLGATAGTVQKPHRSALGSHNRAKPPVAIV